MAVSVVLKGGTLRIVSPELVEPITAGTLDGSVTIAPGKPIEVAATLADEGRSLEIRSTIDQGASGDRALTVVGKGWPIHVREAGVEAKGRFEGTLEARQERGLWALKGDAALVGVEASGPSLQGDRLTLDRVAAACDVEQSATGWTIRKLRPDQPGRVARRSRLDPRHLDGPPATLQGRVDLAALAEDAPQRHEAPRRPDPRPGDGHLPGRAEERRGRRSGRSWRPASTTSPRRRRAGR